MTLPSLTKDFSTDVAIIGAGPVGLFSVFECGQLQMKCTVIDSLDVQGGQCATLYPEKPIYDIPGFPMLSAQELIERLQAQAAPFAPRYLMGQQVESLTQYGTGWRLMTSAGVEVTARVVLVAAGVGAFGPNRPPLPGIEEYEGKSLLYYVKKREDFRGKRVMIAGGGDSAVDWALNLVDIAARVILVHRRPKFRAAPASLAQLETLATEGKIDLIVPYQLAELEGNNGMIESVVVEDLDRSRKKLACDSVLAFFGLSMKLGPILQWGLNLSNNHISVTQSNCSTNLQGIFAIGDIAHYKGKLKLILSGFAEAASAAHAAREYAFPNAPLHFEYSTSMGKPGE
ncbi:MAG: NAD(P)/FAD-dependent oxidoreductase [Candidatus Pacebacteria bacterium]|nr:NAD(P)/FAD-dependent oxidoreductase [Candidatus Paceibacterota bacterium]